MERGRKDDWGQGTKEGNMRVFPMDTEGWEGSLFSCYV